MRDPKRIEKILKGIKNTWEKYPDLRLGQLLLNSITQNALYYIEDDELIEKLEKFYEEIENEK